MLVISILAVLAIPQINSSLRLNRLNTGTSLIASKLSEAKVLAVKRNQQVSFVLDETNGLVWIEAGSTVIGGAEPVPPGTALAITPNSAATIERVTFNSMGALVTSSAVVSVRDTGRGLTKTASVGPTGRINVSQITTY